MTSMSLPSIHEMFPDHLMKSVPRPRPHSSSFDHRSLTHSPTPPMCSSAGCHCVSAPPKHSFHPRSESSSAPYSYPYADSHPHIKPPFGVDGSRIQGHSPHPDYRTRRLSSSDSSHPHLSNKSFPSSTNGGKTVEPDCEDDDCLDGKSMVSVDGAFLVNNLDALGRKHVCPTCFKRFNRPSSLRIHLNTHTGATPFKCPWPNCGREFNVNSNMRRHYRNHLGTPRGHFPSIHGANELRPLAPAASHSIPAHHAYSERSHPVTSDRPQSRNRHRWLEEDAAGGGTHRLRAPSPRDSLSPSPSQASSIASRGSSPTATDRYSPSPKAKYNPSKPYSAGFTDARVRTTLRPAFVRRS